MTDNVELPLPQNSYAEQVVLAGCMRDEKALARCAYRVSQRQAWTRWADTLQEVLRNEYD